MKAHPAAELFPLLEGEELAGLIEDIRAHGQQESCVTWNGMLLDGRNRWAACEKLGIKPEVRPFVGTEVEALQYIVSANLHRRHLTPGQKAGIAEQLEPLFSAAIPKGRPTSGSTTPERIPELTREVGREARTLAAAVTGANPHYVSDMRRLKEAAPKEYAAVMSGKSTIPKAKKIVKQRERQALARELDKKPLPPPKGRFHVIVIDPPWRYDSRSEDATHRAGNPYPDMDLGAIRALPVTARAETDCVLWLWTTNAFIRQAYECLDAWGFTPKTILTWVKDRMGTGDWLRGRTEHCILAVRGRPTVTLTNQTTALEAPMREHSRKPDEFYSLVESLCTGKRLEFFARQPREGWQAWGAETEQFLGGKSK